MAIPLEQIYADYDVLSKAPKADMVKHIGLYRNFMTALKGNANERRLAAQFLAKFLPDFPQLADEVVNSLIDLLENEDLMVRKQGVLELTNCCKINPHLSAKVADVFAQLLVTNDAAERLLISNNLLSLFKLDAKGTLAGVFTQILSGDEEVRHNSIKFVSQKLISLPPDTWKGEIEQLLIEYCNKAILADCSLDEFIGLVKTLAAMPSLSSLQGRQQLVETIADVANFSNSFNPSDREQVVRISQCTRQALNLFSKNVVSNKFAVYLILQVLPSLSQTELNEEAVELAKLTAESATNLGPIAADQLTPLLDSVYNAVVAHMPMPAATAEGDAAKVAESVQAEVDEKFHFTNVECLLYLLHKLASRNNAYLTAEKNATLKPRLQYFAAHNQKYMKQLRVALAGKKPAEIEADESLHLKQLALRTTTNINAMIIDLLHVPPSFKATITLSWRQTAADNSDEKPEQKSGHKNFAGGQENHGDAKRQKFGGGNQQQHQQQQQQGRQQHGGRQWRGGNRGGRRF